jgi:uncharacterized protein YkwD
MKNVAKTITIVVIIVILGFWAVFTDGLIVRNSELRNGLYSTLKTLGTADMVALVNGERTSRGIPALTENSRLNNSAKAKACEMVDKDYFDHYDPAGRPPWHFFKENGYIYHFAGENLVMGYFGDQESMRRLMASPEHKENVLDPNFKEIGIGKCGDYTVQHFGTK